MRKIVKEPFAPKRRHIDNHESRVGWWRALFAVVSLIFLKGNPSRIIRERFPFAEPTLTFQFPRRVPFPSNHNPSETIAASQAMAVHGLEHLCSSGIIR
jgi:hypothetical protein